MRVCVCVCAHCESSLTLLFHAAYAVNFLTAPSRCFPHCPLAQCGYFSLFELSGMRSHKFVVACLCLSVSSTVCVCACVYLSVCLLRFGVVTLLAEPFPHGITFRTKLQFASVSYSHCVIYFSHCLFSLDFCFCFSLLLFFFCVRLSFIRFHLHGHTNRHLQQQSKQSKAKQSEAKRSRRQGTTSASGERRRPCGCSYKNLLNENLSFLLRRSFV